MPNLIFTGPATVVTYKPSPKTDKDTGADIRRLLINLAAIWSADTVHTFSGIEDLDEFKSAWWTDDGDARVLGLTKALFNYRCKDHTLSWDQSTCDGEAHRFEVVPCGGFRAVVNFQFLAIEPPVTWPDLLFEQIGKEIFIAIAPMQEGLL